MATDPSVHFNVRSSRVTPQSVNDNLYTGPNTPNTKSLRPRVLALTALFILIGVATIVTILVIFLPKKTMNLATVGTTASSAISISTTTTKISRTIVSSTSFASPLSSSSATVGTTASSAISISTTTTKTSRTIVSSTSFTSPLSSSSATVGTTASSAISISTPTTKTSRTIVSSTSFTSPLSSSSATSTARPIVLITRAGDPIIGIYSTTAGGNIGGINGTYAALNEYPQYGIDNNVNTKYLNSGVHSDGTTAYQSGLNTGYYVTPVASNASIATGLLFATGNDHPPRDPLTVTLEGTNVTTTAALNLGSSWTLIYSGPTGIDATVDPGRSRFVPQQNFVNTLVFRSYRLLVTTQRDSTTGVQYSEALIVGYL